MPKFYFTKTKAKEERRKGERVVTGKLKNGKTIFKLKKVKRRWV